jgi:hypothetical protein
MAWLSGVIVSRGMSQVSAMMLATVSNVEGIAKSLNDNGFAAALGSGATPGPTWVPPRFPHG